MYLLGLGILACVSVEAILSSHVTASGYGSAGAGWETGSGVLCCISGHVVGDLVPLCMPGYVGVTLDALCGLWSLPDLFPISPKNLSGWRLDHIRPWFWQFSDYCRGFPLLCTAVIVGSYLTQA